MDLFLQTSFTLKNIFSQHLGIPKGWYLSLFYGKDRRTEVRTKLKETSSFNFKKDNLKNLEQEFSGH